MQVNVDTIEYVSNLREMIRDSHQVVITVAGWSMEPFLRNQRDRVLLQKPSRPPKVGDIVFYQRKTGQYVLHRIYKSKPEGYYMRGDHLTDEEGPIEAEAIFAMVTEVERNGRWFSIDALGWRFTSSLWRLLSPARKLYSLARKAMRP